jgi:Protein of unknown function (DUF3301)
MLEIALLAALAAGGWFWWDSLQAREAANAAMRPACRARGYLFLDDTVALASLRPSRNTDGRLQLRRVYRFEFSDTGNNRRAGMVALQGARVVDYDLPEPQAEPSAG